MRFPLEFPYFDLALIKKSLFNKDSVPVGELVESCWWVIGYGLSFAYPPGPFVQGLSGEEALKALPEQGFVQGPIPWNIIVPYLMDLIKKIIEEKLKGT